jgi:hypothetical protein
MGGQGNRPLHLAVSADHHEVSTAAVHIVAKRYTALSQLLPAINKYLIAASLSHFKQHLQLCPGLLVSCAIAALTSPPWSQPVFSLYCLHALAQVVALLLTAGADTRVSNDLRNTPLQLAKSSEVRELLTRMAGSGPEDRARLQQELRLQHERSIARRASVAAVEQQE